MQEKVFSYTSKYLNLSSFRFKGTSKHQLLRQINYPFHLLIDIYYIEKIVIRRSNYIHSMQPFEFHGETSETEQNETNEEHKKLIKALLSVIYLNGEHYIYQG